MNKAKKTPAALVPQPHGGALRRGNPGNRGGNHRSGRPDLAFRERARYLLERARGLEVMGMIVSGDILEMVRAEGDTIIYGPTRNADRIRAFEVLRDSAGFKPKDAPDGDESQGFVILAPPKAKTAEEWLRLHREGLS